MKSTPKFAFTFNTLPDFVQKNLLWVIGITPLVIAALNILAISGGDPQVAAYVLEDLNLISLIMGIILPLIPVAIVWVFIAYLEERATLPKSERLELASRPMYMVWPIVGVAVATMQLTWIIATALMLIFAFADRAYTRRKYKRSGLLDGGAAFIIRKMDFSFVIVLIAVFVIQTVTSGNSTWIPREVIDIKYHEAITGQVLSSNGEWTKFINRDKQVQINPTADIVSRHPCYLDTSVLSDSLLQMTQRQITGASKSKCPSR